MPKSKRPIKKKWTTGPKWTLKELESDYKKGFNVGVRLGAVSKLDAYYLAVIDCDLKSSDPKHKIEMLNKVKEITKDKNSPIVLSGRANGSMHVFFKTTKPLKPFIYARSPHKAKVYMPSVKPSKFCLKVLGTKDIKKGYRLRPAWEIGIMGEGQQVALPPSIHPDTNKKYQWLRKPTSSNDFPVIEIKNLNKTTEGVGNLTIKEDFKFMAVELLLRDNPMSDEMYDLLTKGIGSEDRSAELLKVSIYMLSLGFTQNEILSVLTDKDNYLGEAAYEHAQTRSRKRAALWVMKYTLQKAKKEISGANLFNDSHEVLESVKELEAIKKNSEDKESDEWKGSIKRNHKDGSPKNSFFNVHLIVSNLAGKHCILHDEFSVRDTWNTTTPWGSRKGDMLTDMDLIKVKSFLAHNYRFEPNTKLVNEVLLDLAFKNKFHPIRDYLKALEWDGTQRIRTWLRKYMGSVESPEYVDVISEKVLIAMVKRVFEPGCKFDNVVILEGYQGAGKSTALDILADPWFSDSDLNVGDKDAVLSMQGSWIFELGELSTMSRSDNEMLKHFFSRRIDKIRPPYGSKLLDYPRQSIFIGTTNKEDYFKDETGNRRFWPTKITNIKLKELKKDKDQLFAEAYAMYSMGAEPFVEDPKWWAIAKSVQLSKMEYDDLASPLSEYLCSEENMLPEEGFGVIQALELVPCLAGIRNDRAGQMRIAKMLKAVGYNRVRKRVDNFRGWIWTKSL